MREKIHVKPTKAVSVIGIIAGGIFFIFGLVFGIVLLNEGAMIGVFFMVFWMAIVALIIGFNVYNLVTRKDVVDIETERLGGLPPGEPPPLDFAAKLHKLESLKKEHLISEEEYQQKRKEILEQKW